MDPMITNLEGSLKQRMPSEGFHIHDIPDLRHGMLEL